jgi:hypothetical protein
MRTNRQLIDEIRDTNPSGVEELISRYGPRIQSFLHRRRIPDTECSKLNGDIFLTIVDCIRRNAPPNPEALDGLICSIARRRFAIYKETVGKTGRQAAAVAQAVLHTMPDRDREVLIRYYLGEQRAEQICESFKLTPVQLRLMKSQARALFGELQRRPLLPSALKIERCVA